MAFDFEKLSEIKEFLNTPIYAEMGDYEEADDNIRPLASYIKEKTVHNEYIEPERIKFLFTTKIKKDGGRYVLGTLVQRPDYERYIDDKYDFIVFIFYPIWKDLDPKNKIIQLDKILSGIDMGSFENTSLKKKQADSKEYVSNMKFFGPDNVLDSSEAVHLACESFVEREKSEKKNGKQIREDE